MTKLLAFLGIAILASACAPPVAPTGARTATSSPPSTMTTPTAVSPIPSPDAQTPVPQAWTTFNHGDYSLNLPPGYLTTSADPVTIIADTQETYDAWMQNGVVSNSGLLVQLVSLSLDRKLDANNASSPLATVEQALQREINRTVGLSYNVAASTDVPWENANGETYDGRKVFYPTVSYQEATLGAAAAAKVIGDNAVLFFLLVPNDDSYYVRITVQPANSVLMQVADQILSTFRFTH
jgi:hypothetical protein